MKLFKYIALGSLFAASAAFAHHGSNGQFDSSVRVNVTGTITKMAMVNPHAYVYFDVTAEDGEIQPWRCEMRAGSMLKRTGWTEELLSVGTEITIEGAQARREEFGCMMTTVTFENGVSYQRNDAIEGVEIAKAQVAQVELSGGVPNLNGSWLAPQRERAAAPGGDAGGMGTPPEGGMGAQAAGGGMGAPGAGGMGAPAGSDRATAVGLAAAEGFESDMNPRYHCQATNIFHDFWFDQLVNKVEQTDDKIVITYGFMDIVRTIHLDMDEHPSNIVPSRAGHSIGKWEDNVLVIDTIGFEEGYLSGRSGEMHSDQMHTVERFVVSEDGNSFTQEYTVSDPLYLKESYDGEQAFMRTDAAYDPYNCNDLTEEIVPGF